MEAEVTTRKVHRSLGVSGLRYTLKIYSTEDRKLCSLCFEAGSKISEGASERRNPGPKTPKSNGSFRKFGVPYFGDLTIRILLFRVLY